MFYLWGRVWNVSHVFWKCSAYRLLVYSTRASFMKKRQELLKDDL